MAVDGEQQKLDAADLKRLGYAQELLREMGGFHNFALSFSIISILTGAVTLYGHGLLHGGPLVMTIGWPFVAIMTLTVAASLAELASAYPTAGALYHWSSILGGRGTGFFTAWLNTIGQFAITAGIDYGLSEFVAGMLGLPADRAHVLPIYALVLLSHAILNHVGVRAVSRLNALSAWYHIAGVVLLVGLLFFFAPMQDASFLMRRFSTGDHGYLYVFLVGLLQAQWTFTGYDASAHVTEETVDPRRNAPWGIFLSVAVSAVVGWVMLLAVTLAIPDLTATVEAPNAFIHVLREALGSRMGGTLVWIVIGAMWFCGLGSVTSNSRMLYAFARDGGLPGSGALSRVSPRFQSPHVAVWVSSAGAFLVAVWSQGYGAMVALSTIALYGSYGLPIAAALRARSRGGFTPGPWSLGRASRPIATVALIWIAIITVLFSLPPNQLAGWTFAGFLVLLTIYWFAWMKSRFTGPKLGS